MHSYQNGALGHLSLIQQLQVQTENDFTEAINEQVRQQSLQSVQNSGFDKLSRKLNDIEAVQSISIAPNFNLQDQQLLHSLLLQQQNQPIQHQHHIQAQQREQQQMHAQQDATPNSNSSQVLLLQYLLTAAQQQSVAPPQAIVNADHLFMQHQWQALQNLQQQQAHAQVQQQTQAQQDGNNQTRQSSTSASPVQSSHSQQKNKESNLHQSKKRNARKNVTAAAKVTKTKATIKRHRQATEVIKNTMKSLNNTMRSIHSEMAQQGFKKGDHQDICGSMKSLSCTLAGTFMAPPKQRGNSEWDIMKNESGKELPSRNHTTRHKHDSSASQNEGTYASHQDTLQHPTAIANDENDATTNIKPFRSLLAHENEKVASNTTVVSCSNADGKVKGGIPPSNREVYITESGTDDDVKLFATVAADIEDPKVQTIK
jgi:hypothetical protein